MNHSFIGTEHILLGLIRQGDSVGAAALKSLGITLDAVRQKVEETIGMAGTAPSGSPPFTPRAKKVLELALREALQSAHSYIGTEHILLGLVREGEGVAATVLVGLGADLGLVRQKVVMLMSGYSEEEHPGEAESSEPTSWNNPSFGPEPCCPQCRVALAAGARFRTIDVSPDNADNDAEAISIDVVYCIRCGMTLHMLRSDDRTALRAPGRDEMPGTRTQPLPLRRKSSTIEQTGPPPEDEVSSACRHKKGLCRHG